jgi:hypothetical protein
MRHPGLVIPRGCILHDSVQDASPETAAPDGSGDLPHPLMPVSPRCNPLS